MSKHCNSDYYMASFEKTTARFLQNLNLYTHVLKFVLYCIPILNVKISGMKTNGDDTPSNPRWDFQQVFHLKH